MFTCAGCGAELFRTDAKFESGIGMAELHRALADGTVEEHEDRTLRNAAHRDHLCPLRRPSRPRVPRRAGPDRPALLRELAVLEYEPDGGLTVRPTRDPPDRTRPRSPVGRVGRGRVARRPPGAPPAARRGRRGRRPRRRRPVRTRQPAGIGQGLAGGEHLAPCSGRPTPEADRGRPAPPRRRRRPSSVGGPASASIAGGARPGARRRWRSGGSRRPRRPRSRP